MSFDMVDEKDEKDRYFLEMPDYVVYFFSKKTTMRRNMLEESVVIYCICDEVWKAFGLQDDVQCKMTSAKIMAFSIISAQHYGCNYRQT